MTRQGDLVVVVSRLRKRSNLGQVLYLSALVKLRVARLRCAKNPNGSSSAETIGGKIDAKIIAKISNH